MGEASPGTQSESLQVEWVIRSGSAVAGTVHDVDLERGTARWTHDTACVRCGGAGHSERWRRTGLTCYACGGDGKGPRRTERVYTRAKLAALDAARDKRRTRAAAARAVAEAIRQEEDARVWDAWSAEHAQFVARLQRFASDPELAGYAQRLRQHRVLDADQLRLAEGVVAEREARQAARERARQSKWIGEVGQRCELTLTVKRVLDWSRPPQRRIARFFEDAAGNVVVYVGGAAGLPRVGETATLRATVKEHATFDGVCQTRIERVVRLSEAGAP